MAQAEAHFIYRLQTVGGFGGKSDQLNAYNVLARRPRVSSPATSPATARRPPSRVRAAAAQAPAFDRRVLLSIVPRGQHALALPGSEPVSVS